MRGVTVYYWKVHGHLNFLSVGQPGEILLLLAGTAFVAGLSRGFSGFGAGLIFIPVASAAVGPLLAAPILMVIDWFGSLPILPWAWRHAERGTSLELALGALLGVPLGLLVLTGMEPVALRWGLSLTIFGLVALLASGWRYTGRPHLAVTVVVGSVSGFLNGAAQIGGPPVVAYLLGRAAASAQDLRANIVLYFAYAGIWSAAVFFVAGLLSMQVVMLAVLIVPCYVAGTILGMRIFGLASQQTFRRICYALITVAAFVGLPVFR